MKRGIAAGVIAAVVLAGAAGFYFFKDKPSAGGPAKVAASSSRTSNAPTRRGVGEHLRYALTYSVESASAGAVGLSFKLDGALEVTCLRATETGVDFRAQWQGTAQAFREGQSDAGIASMVQGGLHEPFYFQQDGDGQLKELRFQRGVARLSQTLVRSILTSSQLVRSGPAGDLWQSDEMDENGTYVAQYQRVADGLTIRKEKLRYRSSYGDQVQHRILQSDTTFELDAERRMAKVVAKEGVAATSSMPVPEMSSTLQLKLQLVGAGYEAVNPVWLSDLARAERVLLSEPGTKSSVDAELDTARASKLSAEQALLRLRSTLGDKLELRAEAYNALMSHVRLDPKLVGQLLEHIQKHGPLSKDLISVLRDAGTPEAQAALRQLLQENDLPAGERLQVVRGLSRVDQPTAETVQTLKGLIDDPVLGEQAQYGLGGNAYRLQESNPELAKEAVTVIQTRLQNAPDDPTRQIALEALGNAGVPDSLAAVQEQLNSPTQGVQVAATQALRRIPGASVDMLLAKQLREASVPQVRMAAAEAIRYREPTPILVTALAESLRLEPVVQVRRSSMDIVAYFADRSSVLREALRQAAQADPDPSLRERAQTYLKH